ncbi:MAG: hypothetical protein V1901_03845 [Patescibacteria group bacterium]
MASTHVFSESNGAGENITDGISNINMGSIDTPNLVPGAYLVAVGTNSFCKYIRSKFTGVWTEISNMKFWKSSGALVAGETVKASANATYTTPSEVDTGDSNCPTDVGTALAINSAEGATTIIYDAPGVSGYSGYVRLQIQSTVETPSGQGNQKEYIFQFDES